MRSLWFLLLLHSVSVVAGQRAAEVAERQLQRAEAALVHAVLREMGQGGNNANGEREPAGVEIRGQVSAAAEADSPSAELISKRQHPGKRLEDLEKRQYPGKREVGEDEEVDYREVEKRQHPGRRGADWLHSGEEEVLSKRQHPGKKRLVLSSQSRQPGRGGWETESDSREIEAQTSARQLPSPCDSRDPVVCDLLQLLGVVSKTEKKRQHPGR